MPKTYPASILKIILEAPVGYCLVVLMDYSSKRRTAKQLLEEWDRDKSKFNGAS